MSIAYELQGVIESGANPVRVPSQFNERQRLRPSPTQPPSPELQFISVEEVARKLGGVCQRTIRRLSDKGELCQPVKVGGRSMYPKQEVIDFMYRKMRERRA